MTIRYFAADTQSAEHWRHGAMSSEASLGHISHSMLHCIDKFTDATGAPLRTFWRGRLAALFADPRPSTWEDAHGVVVNAWGLTMWQAWIALDPDAPRTGRHVTLDPFDRVIMLRDWERVPDEAMLERISRYVLEHAGTPYQR